MWSVFSSHLASKCLVSLSLCIVIVRFAPLNDAYLLFEYSVRAAFSSNFLINFSFLLENKWINKYPLYNLDKITAAIKE